MQAFILIPLAICFMATPSRFIMFQEKGGASGGEGSQRSGFHASHSKEYMNLEEFESAVNKQRSMQGEGRERADTGSLMEPESMNNEHRDTSLVVPKKRVQFDSL